MSASRSSVLRRRGLTTGCAVLGLGLFACATEPAPGATDGEPAKTQVIVSIERSEATTPDAKGSASAIARFVSVSASADGSRVLLATGAALELPAVDTCRAGDATEAADSPSVAPSAMEFVEAGDVTLSASGVTTPLVPHAFPAAGSLASGVLYATRDRAPEGLPAAVPYQVSATGSSAVAPFRIVADAPRAPVDVTVDGALLPRVAGLRTSRSQIISWAPGDAADLVYVELLAYDGSPSVVCAFRDETGSGTVPANAFTGSGSGRLAVHRVRTRHFEGGSPMAAVRFDFQVGTAVDFAR